MTDYQQPDDVVPAQQVWLWVGQPDVGRETLLMVLTNDVDGLAYRPLMAFDRDVADQLEVHARAAAAGLGVTAVLREYECRAVLTKIETVPDGDDT